MKKPIPNFPGYFATEDGRIVNLVTGNWMEYSKGREYPLVHMKDANGKRHYVQANRAIMSAFNPASDDLQIVAYRDHDRTNLHVDNMYWSYHTDVKEPNRDLTKIKAQGARWVNPLVPSRNCMIRTTNRAEAWQGTIEHACDWLSELDFNHFDRGQTVFQLKHCLIKSRPFLGYKFEFVKPEDKQDFILRYEDILEGEGHFIRIYSDGRIKDKPGKYRQTLKDDTGLYVLDSYGEKLYVADALLRVFRPDLIGNTVGYRDGNENNIRLSNLYWAEVTYEYKTL